MNIKYIQQKNEDRMYCLKWLVDNQLKVYRFLRKYKMYEDRKYFRKKLYSLPIYAKVMIEDDNLTDEEKEKKLDLEICHNPYVVLLCIADAGEGKTSTVCTKLRHWKNITGWSVYQLGSEINDPLFDGIVYDIDHAPSNCFIYVDEIGQVWNARQFGDKGNQKLNYQLQTLRHNDKKVIGCTQKAANVDISFIRAHTHLIMKYVSNIIFEREQFMNELMTLMSVQKGESRSMCMVKFGNKISKFRIEPDSYFFKEEFGKNKRRLSQEQIINKARFLIELGFKVTDLPKKLSLENGFTKDVAWYKDSIGL